MLIVRRTGFTLIEMLVVLTVIGVATVLGLPQLTTFVASSRIRTSAEGYANAIAQARAEAVRLNANVEFLTSTGMWQVRRITDGTILYSAAGKEGTSEVSVTTTPTGSTRVAFDVFGRPINVSPVDGSSAITRIDVDVPNGTSIGSNRRPLRLLLDRGGSVKVCDPAVASTDPRACA